jgi:hypothetical protein
MSKIRIFDMNCSQTTTPIEGARPLRSGKSYSISDISSLPAEFTQDFAALTVGTGADVIALQKELQDCHHVGIQILLAAKGSGFSSLPIKIQQSNLGGTDAKVWVDVPNASATLTDTGSAFITLAAAGYSNQGIKLAKFYRVFYGATSGGTATSVYAIAYGLAD